MYSKFRMARLGLVICLALAMVLSMACGGGGSTPPTPVALAPTLTAQPQSQTVVAGTAASLSVTATGTGTLSYQWKKDATDLAGQTSANLSFATVGGADAASYTVVVTNTEGGASASVTSAAATLAVNQPPVITPIMDQTVVAGTDVTFTASATSVNGSLSYQWKKDGTDLPGKTASILSFTPAASADAGSYSVLVTNTLNSTTTSATSNTAVLTVNPAPTMPVIATHPVSQTIVAGNPVTFSVSANASAGVLSYQWRKGGMPIVGETASSCTVPSVQASNAGSFDVLVTSSLSGVSLTTTSNAAVLSVNTPPTIGTHLSRHVPHTQIARMVAHRTKRRLLRRKAVDGTLKGRTVDADIRDVPHPPDQVLVQSLVALPFQTSQRVSFRITHAPFHLPLGPGAIRQAGLWNCAPVAPEGLELRMEHGPATSPVIHQRLGIVRQELLRHAAEVLKGPLQPHDPVPLVQASKDLDVAAAAVAQGRHEHIPLLAHPADLKPLLPEIHLHLLPWRCLEPHGHLLGPLPTLPERAQRPLHRPQAHRNPHGLERLPEHVRVANPTLELALDPEIVGVQDPWSPLSPIPAIRPAPDPVPDRVAGYPHLPGYLLHSPAQLP